MNALGEDSFFLEVPCEPRTMKVFDPRESLSVNVEVKSFAVRIYRAGAPAWAHDIGNGLKAISAPLIDDGR